MRDIWEIWKMRDRMKWDLDIKIYWEIWDMRDKWEI